MWTGALAIAVTCVIGVVAIDAAGCGGGAVDSPPTDAGHLSGWMPLEVPGCPVSVSGDPVRDAPLVAWAACVPARDGCRASVPPPGVTVVDAAVQTAGGRGRFIASLGLPDPMNRLAPPVRTYISVVQVEDDVPLVAVSEATSASIGCLAHVALGDPGLVLTLVHRADWPTLVASDWDDPASVRVLPLTPADVGAGPLASMQAFAVARSTGFVVAGSPAGDGLSPTRWSALRALSLPSGTLVSTAATRAAADLRSPVPLGDGMIVAANHELLYARADATFAPALHGVSEPMRIGAVALDRPRAGEAPSALVWVETRATWTGSMTFPPAAFVDATLWTAPVTTDASAIAPRMVVSLPGENGDGPLVAGGGVAVCVTSPSAAVVVRLSDGAVWTLPSGSAPWTRPLWADETEVWLATTTGVVRQRQDGLGPPDP